MIAASVMCLASIINAEARGEPLEGQIAVGQVVLNRMEDRRWPDSICGIAAQEAQFASTTPAEEIIELAEEIIAGEYEDMSGGATHFYSGKSPWWAGEMELVGRIAGHTFMLEERW